MAYIACLIHKFCRVAKTSHDGGFRAEEVYEVLCITTASENIELILSASVPHSAGGPRAVKRGPMAPSTPGRIGEN